MNYEKLFEYLEKKVNFRKENGKHTCTCDGTLDFTIQFCKENKIPYQRVIGRVEQTGGFCDCEVLFNSTEQIEPTEEM